MYFRCKPAPAGATAPKRCAREPIKAACAYAQQLLLRHAGRALAVLPIAPSGALRAGRSLQGQRLTRAAPCIGHSDPRVPVFGQTGKVVETADCEARPDGIRQTVRGSATTVFAVVPMTAAGPVKKTLSRSRTRLPVQTGQAT
jgi:hypothetical protein